MLEIYESILQKIKRTEIVLAVLLFGFIVAIIAATGLNPAILR